MKRKSSHGPKENTLHNEADLPLIDVPQPRTLTTQALKVSIFQRGSSGIWHARIRESGEELRLSTHTILRNKALEFARLLFLGVNSRGGILAYQEWAAAQRRYDAHFRRQQKAIGAPAKRHKPEPAPTT